MTNSIQLFLVACNTRTWIGRYEDANEVEIRISSQSGNLFRGTHQIPGPDLLLNGTLEDDCTGLMNIDLLGPVQPFQYFPDNCSIVMLTTGNVFRSREDECLGKTYVYLSLLHSQSVLVCFISWLLFYHFLGIPNAKIQSKKVS